MKDYYKVLDIDNINDNKSTSYQNVISEATITSTMVDLSYKIKIARFKKLPFLTKQMITEIKLLKEAYYVLHNDIRRSKYDKIYKKFKLNKVLADDNRIDNTKICDRLFSLSHINR